MLPRLPVNKWLLISLIFMAGLLCLAVSRQIQSGLVSLILDLVGAFLVVAVPLEVLREVFFEEANQAAFVARISKVFDDKIDAELMHARQIGLGHIENSLPLKGLFDGLQPGDTLWWLDTFSPGHKTWIDHVRHAVERGVHVKMMVLDPESPLCALRAREIGELFTSESFVAELRLFIADFQKLQRMLDVSDSLGHMELLLYDDLLGVPCYIVTRAGKPVYAYSSMYLTRPTGVEFPHFYWTPGPMCEHLLDYVVKKYDSIRGVSVAPTLSASGSGS